MESMNVRSCAPPMFKAQMSDDDDNHQEYLYEAKAMDYEEE